MMAKKEFLMSVGLIAIFVNVFVMLIAPMISGELFEILRSVSIALFGSGLILFDILQKMTDKQIFKNRDITTLGTFFLVFWGVVGTVFEVVPENVAEFFMDWGLVITGVVLIAAVNLMDVFIK